jgi:sortase A
MLALQWTQRLLTVCGAAMLGYAGFVLGDSSLFQRRAGVEFERMLREEPRQPEVWIGPDGLIGRIEIPRIGLSAVVFEGTGGATLERSVGHVPGTALPGQPGNAGLAGHRDSFFRPLKDIRRDDMITVATLRGEYRYRVVSTRIVRPADVWVLSPTEAETLTLVTCHPFNFVGGAPDRFVVRAARVI